jgi:hypothetical protein
MARDACKPNLVWTYGTGTNGTSITGNNATITGISVSTTGNTCSTTIPVTVPGSVTNTQGFKTEKIGNDPLTIWVNMAGKPVTFTLSTPLAV